MGDAEAIVLVTAFVTIGVTVVLRGPLGRALAERIAGRRLSGDGGEAGAVGEGQQDRLDRVVADVDDVRHRLADLEERQEFAERLLAAGSRTASDD